MKNKNFKVCYLFFIFSLIGCSQNENYIIEETQLSIDDIYPNANIAISTHSDWTRTHYPGRINEFKNNPLTENDIVLLGNSITEQGGNWSNRLAINNAKNRGIAGDTSEGVLARLGELFYYKPSKVFILIGINDLFHPSMTPELISANILEIVNKIRMHSPNTELFVQTVLPTTTESLIEKIDALNAMLENGATEHPYELIQIHHLFALQDGKMNMEFSTDGVHLNEDGYLLWTEHIKTKL